MTNETDMMPLSPSLAGKLAAGRRARAALDALSAVTPRRRRPVAPRRIAILLQWGIGDAVLALPLLRGLKTALPDASIEVVGKPFLAELFAGEPSVDRTHVLQAPWTAFHGKYRFWRPEWRELTRQLLALRRHAFDLAVGLRLDPRETIMLRLLRSRTAFGVGAAGGRFWLTRDLGLTQHEYMRLHRSEIAALACAAITGRQVSSIPRLVASAERRSAVLRQLSRHGFSGGIVLAVSFGAAHKLRRWDPAKVSAALRHVTTAVGFVVLIEDGSGSSREIRLPPGVPHMTWRSGLAELKALLSIADATFCADSGIMHMAAACGSRVVAVFGPTSIENFGPAGKGHRVLAVEPMECRPCFDACIYRSPICLERLSADAVGEALAAALDGIAAERRSTAGAGE